MGVESALGGRLFCNTTIQSFRISRSRQPSKRQNNQLLGRFQDNHQDEKKTGESTSFEETKGRGGGGDVHVSFLVIMEPELGQNGCQEFILSMA